MDNLNILVEAKKEYLEQLSIIMAPPMIEVYEQMYNEAVNISKGRKVLIMFQKLLQEVPNWNETIVKKNSDNISNRCAWFKDLLAAVFVSSVKILSAVRLSKNSKKFSVKIPSNEVFIHTCFINAAKDLYQDPYIYHENQNEHTRNDKLYERFCVCIEKSVKELIPVQDILQTYMLQENEFDPSDASIEDPDVDEAPDEEPTVEEEPLVEEEPPVDEEPLVSEEPAMSEQPPIDAEPIPQTNPLDNEFRQVSTVPQGAPLPHPGISEPEPEPEESEDLFPDAPDSNVKKIGRY